MPSSAVVPDTNGTIDHSWYGRRKTGLIVESAALTAGSSSYTLKQKLPARCRVLWSSLKNVSAVGLAHSGNSGTSVLCDTFALISATALPTTSGTSSGTSDVIAVSASGATSTSTSGASRSVSAGTAETSAVVFAGEQLNAAKAYNTGTSDLNLYLIPMDTGGSEDFNVNTTPTNGYNFGTTGTVHVQVFFESFTTNPAS